MAPVPRPESRHVFSTPPAASRTFPVYAPGVAAHLAVLGYEVTLVPRKGTHGAFIWLAPSEARDAAKKFLVTLRLLSDARDARSAAEACSTGNDNGTRRA